jgi:hypothetical protein
MAVVGPFVDPLIDGTAAGRWDPTGGAWIPELPDG